MARILVSLRNGWRRPDDFNAMPPFYETFLKGLRDTGNEVFCFHHKEYNRDFSVPISDEMKSLVKRFNPELCILFNNTFWDISELVDCPILIYDVDSPIEYTHTDNLLSNPDRYNFIINQKQGASLMKEVFNASDENIHYIPFFTDVHSNPNVILKNNIVFLGSNWTWHGYNFLQDFLKKGPIDIDIQRAEQVLDYFKQYPFEDSKSIYYKLGLHPQKLLNISDIRRAAYEVSGVYRMKVLAALADLGLEIRGQYWNIDCMNYYPEIIKCVNNTPTYSKQENEDFYNSAKISVNTQHIQTVSGFSFRVCDIMASNACLVTSPSQDLKELFPQVKIPMFTSPYEAREICQNLLKNENMRQDIVLASHEAIDNGYRIKDVIKHLEQITGIKLSNELRNSGLYVNYGMETGTLDIYSDEDPSARLPRISSSVAITVPPIKGKKTINSKTKQEPKTEQTLQKVKKERTNKLNPICALWYNTLGKHFGYDPYNRHPKRTVYLGKMLVYEKLIPEPNREEFYFLAMPLISRTKMGSKTLIRLLFFEKMFNFLKKQRDKRGLKKKGTIISQPQLPSVESLSTVAQLDFVMPKGGELRSIYSKKEMLRESLKAKINNHEKIKVCLFVCRISCWFMDDLYRMLEESDIFIPYIVVKPFLTMGKSAMIDYMNTTYDVLSEKGYRVLKTYDEGNDSYLDVRETLNPDIVFYTKYWPPQFRPEYYIKQFMDKLTFYIPYAFDIGRHNIVYSFDLLNYVDRFLYNTPIHKEMAEKYMPNHGENVYIIGSPKLDVFFSKDYIPTDVWKKQGKKKKRIIWAPHHEDQVKEDMYQFDAFFYISDFMLEIADKYKDSVQFAFKPHPMLKPKVEFRWGQESAEDYYRKWQEKENCQLEEGSFQDLFLTSDAMILDSVSFIAEYMAVNKPALFTVTPTSKVKFNEFGEKAFEELYHTDPDSLREDIERFIQNIVIDGNDLKMESRTAFIAKHILPPNGKTATQNIYDNILDEIQNGDKKKR